MFLGIKKKKKLRWHLGVLLTPPLIYFEIHHTKGKSARSSLLYSSYIELKDNLFMFPPDDSSSGDSVRLTGR